MEDTTSTSTHATNRELRTDVAARFRDALGSDEPPATLDELADAMARRLADEDVTLGVETLCRTESSRHEARIGDRTEHFACVLDTLLLPFVLDDPGPIDVRSRSPASGTVVEIAVSREGVTVDPEDAVVSIGIDADAVSDGEYEDVAEYGYEMVCPYINAFPDREEYEEWASETTSATTMPLSPGEGHVFARRFAEQLL